MNTRHAVLSAVAAVLSLGALHTASAADDHKGKEKCYGVAKAGQNDCASLSGTHSCAGQTAKDNAPEDWKYVAKGACKQAGGMTADEAKAKAKK